jgi:hypothetical protein
MGRNGESPESTEPSPEDLKAEAELQARARILCQSLPIVARPGFRDQLLALGCFVFFAFALWWALRRHSLALEVFVPIVLLLVIHEIVRTQLQRAELGIDKVTVRSMRGRATFRYDEIDDVRPGGARQMRIYLKDGRWFGMDPGAYKDTDLLLIIGERKYAQTEDAQH